MGRSVRIGIDVGGTFTDAVVIDGETYEVIIKRKVPTTHDDERGVAAGIMQVVSDVLACGGIDPADVSFIAHGTTQATNALLEGDVAKVGVIGMGGGAEAPRARKETRVGDIELAPGKRIAVEHEFIDGSDLTRETARAAVRRLRERECEVIVASESYSVDDPANELMVCEVAVEEGLPATGGHVISQLYGLMARTRTAVVNAALIPKMMETAEMTERAVREAGITRPLMVMRCDGGVMSVDEVRRRPILTMLSGLAAGVAGALMDEKVTDGIFVESGGTSTDISAIKDGKVMVKSAQAGGRKLHVSSLDVRTVGIAGGSMIVVENGEVVDVGPRSAHIAGLEYEVFAETGEMEGARLELVSPCEGDRPVYAAVACAGGARRALTLAGAANVLGYVPQGDYARGNDEAARLAWAALAAELGGTAEALCRRVLEIAIGRVADIARGLIREYELDPRLIEIVGGGGSASVIAPALGEAMGIRCGVAASAPFISTIGVALALVREQIERSVVNPGDDDVRRIRHDVAEAAVRAGAAAETVEVTVEVDAQRNLLRATATGATELRTKDRARSVLDPAALRGRVAAAAGVTLDAVEEVAQTGRWRVYRVQSERRALFGLLRAKRSDIKVVDDEGVIRLQRPGAHVSLFPKGEALDGLMGLVEELTRYSDAGATPPKVHLLFGQRIVDLSGTATAEQIESLAGTELEFAPETAPIVCIATRS